MARQYCGTLGKVEHSQVGVFAAYASRHGYALVDKRLFMPEQWFSDAYAERRHKCQVPAEVTFHTKPQVAADMVKAIRNEGRLPFRYLGGCPRITPNASLGYVEPCGSCVMPSVASTLSGKRPLTPTRMAP